MQIKIFKLIAFALMASVAVVNGQSASAQEALTVLKNLRTTIAASQVDFWNQLQQLRLGVNGQLGKFYEESLDLIAEKVETISESDTEVSATLAALNQDAACVIQATNLVQSTMQFVGVLVSDCIVDVQDIIDNGTADALPDANVFTSVELKINVLARIIETALIGRNIYTNYADIEALANANFESSKTEIENELAGFESSTDLPESWQSIITEMDACFVDAEDQTKNAITMIRDLTVPSCIRFMNRGARSGPPPVIEFDPEVFFPKYHHHARK